MVVVAAIAALFKLGIALTTFGTNDVVAFYQFAKAIETQGVPWTYQHSVLFNHPPLVGYFLAALASLDHQPIFQQAGLTFPFFLRLPGILADFAVALLLLWVVAQYPRFRPRRRA
jgi:hypothetical protein